MILGQELQSTGHLGGPEVGASGCGVFASPAVPELHNPVSVWTVWELEPPA